MRIVTMSGIRALTLSAIRESDQSLLELSQRTRRDAIQQMDARGPHVKTGSVARHVGPRFSLIAASILAAASPALASTWRVATDGSGDFTSVQAGIDAAASGDTVIVMAGHYPEAVQFRGRNIVLRSAGGPAVTTIDGAGLNASVVCITHGEDRRTVLEGFTITGGTGSGNPPPWHVNDHGGGVFILDSEPVVRGNIIEDNTAIGPNVFGYGGGVFCFADVVPGIVKSPLIEENVIRDNQAGGNGGGVGALGHAIPAIIRNTIVDNRVVGGDGGGVWMIPWVGGSIVRDNIISGNIVGDHGGGIYAASAIAMPIAFLIEENVVTSNAALARAGTGDSGGGVWLSHTNALVLNNTLALNTGAGPGGAYGGNLVVLEQGSPRIERNIIALATEGGGVLCRNGVTPTFLDNLVWGNAGGDALGQCTDWLMTSGNLQADPLFCNSSAGDFGLPANSPAQTHPVSPLGAIPDVSCAVGTIVRSSTWSAIKALFR